VGSGKGGHRLPVAFETEPGLQFVGHQLEVGWLLQGQKLLEEVDGFRGPVRPVVAAGEFGGKLGAFLEEAGAEPVKMGAADLEVLGSVCSVNQSFIELFEDMLKERIGEAFGKLLFL
jgi:hypothetical protein